MSTDKDVNSKHSLPIDAVRISPYDPLLRYTGRVDTSNPEYPTLTYAYSSVEFRFTGTSLAIEVANRQCNMENYLGFIVDGYQYKLKLPDDDRIVRFTLASGLDGTEHTAVIFKRQDGCHYVDFHAIFIDAGSRIDAPSHPVPARRMEVFGDSVSVGDVVEAVDHVGMSDPENHNGLFSNSWYSYAAVTARKLGAQLHDTSQSGIALRDGTGWFNGPHLVGMESVFDKTRFNPVIGPTTHWDFSKYIPHVVVVALGQNDSNPRDIMKENMHSDAAQQWKASYRRFASRLREIYPNALIILATTILEHDKHWDAAIDEVADSLHDPKIVHFMYSLTGKGTPGHTRIPEAEGMAEELAHFIESFGDSIWS